MITIIDGQEYNTQAAECVSRAQQGEGEPWWIEVRLYLTSDGRWFLHERGGPLTLLPQTPDGLVSPMTTEQAREWLEQHDDLDVVRKSLAGAPPACRSEAATREIRLLLGLPEPD